MQTCVIHKQRLNPTLQNSLCKNQAVTWPKIGTTYVLICQEQSFYSRQSFVWSTCLQGSAHMFRPYRTSPLWLSALQPRWLAFNSWKHCTFPHLRAFALFPPTTLSLSLPTFFYLTLHSQTGVIYTPLCFFHST